MRRRNFRPKIVIFGQQNRANLSSDYFIRWLQLKPLDHMTKKQYLGSNYCLRREYAKCIYMARAKGITSIHITIKLELLYEVLSNNTKSITRRLLH
jgi:hypothetical protein